MRSKFIRTDLVFAWPPAKIAAMGAEGASNNLYGDDLRGLNGDDDAERAALEAEFREKFANPYRAAASGHIDDILIPAETRPRLIAALELLRDKQAMLPSKKHGNMPM